jgi:transcriptional regulator with XRE-family HTH domain
MARHGRAIRAAGRVARRAVRHVGMSRVIGTAWIFRATRLVRMIRLLRLVVRHGAPRSVVETQDQGPASHESRNSICGQGKQLTRLCDKHIVCSVDSWGGSYQTSFMAADPRYPAFGEAMAVRREHLRMTQAELASRVSLSRASIANIERGRQSVFLHHACDIAAALGLAVTDLLPAPTKSTIEDRALSVSDPVSPKAHAQINDLIATALASAKVRS